MFFIFIITLLCPAFCQTSEQRLPKDYDFTVIWQEHITQTETELEKNKAQQAKLEPHTYESLELSQAIKKLEFKLAVCERELIQAKRKELIQA